LVFNLFYLPNFSYFSLSSKVLGTKQSGYELLNYIHPAIPQVDTQTPPTLSAQSFILIDNDSNTTLLAKNQYLRTYPASITKLATAITALNVYSLDEIVTVPESYSEGKVTGLQSGEKITVRDLISALLIHSANDAAVSLAAHHPLGVSGFLDQMNLIATKYNLTATHFTNVDGIHQPHHYSTVFDLAQIARISVKNPVLIQAVKTKSLNVSDLSDQIVHRLVSTNELLGVVPEIEGLKTGWTPEAGGCFVGLINLNGHYLISVVAQSVDRFADTRKLVDWSKTHISYTAYQP
jgi:D-alanyl-D-alanine carboxypeptidase (penicillin-binding protein 5/6)